MGMTEEERLLQTMAESAVQLTDELYRNGGFKGMEKAEDPEAGIEVKRFVRLNSKPFNLTMSLQKAEEITDTEVSGG